MKSASKAKKAKVSMLKKFVTKVGTPENNIEHTTSVKKHHDSRKSSNMELKKAELALKKNISSSNMEQKKNTSVDHEDTYNNVAKVATETIKNQVISGKVTIESGKSNFNTNLTLS